MIDKPGRNDPCWCGSGRKYKRCHLDQDRAGGVTPSGTGRATARKRNPLCLDPTELASMRKACEFNAGLIDYVRPYVVEGVTTNELDRLAHEYTLDHGHTPACLGYHGYPKTICTSINEVVCHGIPEERRLLSGDIVNVDLTTIVDGWYGDQSETFLIGEVSDTARRLVQVTFECLHLAIEACRPFGSVNDIGRAVEKAAHPEGFSVVREYQGHGIGREFHQDPGVLHYPAPHMESTLLEPGMCFTIEPMINEGTWETVLDRGDGWTVRTQDLKLSAQFEHTVVMTHEGAEILTGTQAGPGRDHRF